jgi:protein transport protein SEC24
VIRKAITDSASHHSQYTLPLLDNPFSQRVNAIIAKTREMRRNPYWQQLYVVKADAEPALRNWALSLLIEDRVDRTASYSQFLSLVKDKVRWQAQLIRPVPR